MQALMLVSSDFLRLLLRHLHDLLQAQDEYDPGHWVKTDAAKASNMKQSETLRYVYLFTTVSSASTAQAHFCWECWQGF